MGKPLTPSALDEVREIEDIARAKARTAVFERVAAEASSAELHDD